ncbi:hypothetical protein GRX03_09205 [Halovenus sp. WSH3]|uniref:Uncharacterized protein n=1 Tax=Halovenus carboxidivorans TaxID=2692199 RepID=A0A6B0TA69_9EURY|nr:hypothetical protein [Halovenus carboxidivorans]MXR51780.1 hypothetical protein [Halovenus carboxidivorans]
METKDAIARELLDLDDSDAAETIDDAYASAVGAAVDIQSRGGDPEFLNDEREGDVEILTGDAE